MSLSKRVQKIKPSATLAVSAKAKAMKAQGIDVIGFGAGEPDFDTPDSIKAAAKKALDAGFTKYTPESGIDELKKAVADKFKRDNGLDYDKSQVIVSCGGKHSLYNLYMALLDKGDEVVIPAPYWVSYPDMALLCDAKPVFVKSTEKNGFKIKPADLKKALTPKTKLVVINSPSNPTGAAYSADELKALAAVLKKHDCYIVCDDIYESMVYDGFKFTSFATVADKALRERCIVVNGVSKTYSMTGWRIGYAAGPKDVIAAMSKIQGQSTSNPTSFAQKGAVEALTGPQDFLKKMVDAFVERRDYAVKALNDMPEVTCQNPQGAFYVLPNFNAYLGLSFKGKTIKDDMDLCDFLLDEVKVAAVPGGAFGAPGYIRLSYCTSMDNIKEGLKRIGEGIKLLK
jgi:aspartate aminotransferase